MKMSKKIIALLLTLVLALSALTAMTVFAQEIDTSEFTDEDWEALLGGASVDDEDISYTDTSDTDMSVTDLISTVNFKTETVKLYGISLLVPENAKLNSIESSDLEFYNSVGYSKLEVLNDYKLVALCQEESESGYVYYSEVSVYQDSPYAKAMGDYSSLSKEQLDDIIATKTAQGKANGYDYNSVLAVRNAGQQYVIARIDQNGVTQAEITTAINGDYYDIMVYIKHGGSEKDIETVNEIIKSVKVKGETKTADCAKTFAVIALVLAVLLVIVVALLVFFIVRFSAFSKASNSRFNIIGFDMPDSEAFEQAESETEYREE